MNSRFLSDGNESILIAALVLLGVGAVIQLGMKLWNYKPTKQEKEFQRKPIQNDRNR